MLLFEFEGKQFLREHGIATPNGVAVEDADQVTTMASALVAPTMVKAQVLIGGRGKAGGVLTAEAAGEREVLVRRLLGSEVKGQRVHSILLEERIPTKAEYYAAVMIDGSEMLALLGTHGGIDIETFFAEEATSIEAIPVDLVYGLQGYQIRAALERLGIRPELWPGFVEFVSGLLRTCRNLDATLVEVNPVGETADGRLVALDARIEVDEGALFRQPALKAIHAGRSSDSGIMRALRELDVQYVPMGGNVGLLSSGAGAGVAILDWLDLEGEKAAGFMDIDYAILAGRTEEAIRVALRLFGDDPRVRSILVNFTSCGVRVDSIATSLVKVLRDVGGSIGRPCFIHIQGNRGAEADAIIREAGYRLCATLGTAVREACRAARAERHA